ncbi:MAG TPA: leucyl aminopeptidase family protein, partial [Geminicoccaceae bacterium]|nr:leucyl aminopeptidase family protein [Geminicoccaceae bacterium]
MLPCFVAAGEADARPVAVIPAARYSAWQADQPDALRGWLIGIGFEAKPGSATLLPGPDGALAGALLVLSEPVEPWGFAALRGRLPAGDWRLEWQNPAAETDQVQAALGWALASYRFERYRKQPGKPVRLVVEGEAPPRHAETAAEAVYLARDLINTPASDLGPAELAAAAEAVATRFNADFRTIEGDRLLVANYPAIHAVGRASPRAPRLIELVWGAADAPKLTLVGKGVCFDTGGLDLKNSQNMLLMKKDMGGAAVMLGLAQAVMAEDLPVRLRLLIGAVENSIDGSAFRPGDVLCTRKGLTVEIGNTDAEGRLVLADLLAEGDREQPDLMIDCATLTGAARVALGPGLPALFTPDDRLAEDLIAAGQAAFEPVWRLPLHQPYREMLDSTVADINNAGSGGFAGAI